MTILYLQNDGINGGSMIDLGTRDLNTGWDIYTQDEPTPGKTPLPWNPHEIDFLGVGNQKFVITGHFCEGSSVNAKTGSVRVQFGTLGSFCNIGSPSWIISDNKNYIVNGIGSTRVLPFETP